MKVSALSKLLLLLLLCLAGPPVHAQHNPAKVSVSYTPVSGEGAGAKAQLEIKVEPNAGWHVYSAVPSAEGVYNHASIDWSLESRGFEAVDSLLERGPMISEFDDLMGGQMRYYKKPVLFVQKLNLTEGEVILEGTFDYMACDDEKCLMFSEEFKLKP